MLGSNQDNFACSILLQRPGPEQVPVTLPLLRTAHSAGERGPEPRAPQPVDQICKSCEILPGGRWTVDGLCREVVKRTENWIV
jgi:hypothetical protein